MSLVLWEVTIKAYVNYVGVLWCLFLFPFSFLFSFSEIMHEVGLATFGWVRVSSLVPSIGIRMALLQAGIANCKGLISSVCTCRKICPYRC